MSRKYKRYTSRRNGGGNPLGLLVILAFFALYRYWKICLVIAGIAIAVFFLWCYLKDNSGSKLPAGAEPPTLNGENTAEPQKPEYSTKASLMTDCEKDFFEAIKRIVSPNYIVQPQINLASIIDKESHSRYRNELFRNIDFGIFTQDYKLLVLIEINDATHTESNRRDRDQKVKAICEEAGVPLVTLWAKYGVNDAYITKRLSEHLTLNSIHADGNADAPHHINTRLEV